MALYYAPALSINKFEGGYKAISEFTDLQMTETFDSKNIIYTEGGVLKKRSGSERMLNVRLTNSSTTSQGEQIRGHYYFRKLTTDSAFHVVMAGNRVFNYTSATANQIDTGYTTSTNSFFTFAQCKDPRSAADDSVFWVNGVNNMTIWNGSSAPAVVSDITSSTQVPLAKYAATLKSRIYLGNQLDSADADAGLRVSISSFGPDGFPDPHRFLDHFYVGGSDHEGDLRGLSPIEDQMVLYTRKSIWKFAPGSTLTLSTTSLRKIESNLGLLAPRSLVNTGKFHIFLSDRGVWAFDGINSVQLSEKVDIDLLKQSNIARLERAVAKFEPKENQYHLYYADENSTENNVGLIYDLRLKIWQPPVTGRRVGFLSIFDDENNQPRLIWGDYRGYLYKDDLGSAEGMQTGYNIEPSSVTSNTLTDNTQNFTTAGDGLAGQLLHVYEGQGKDNYYYIQSNTSNTLTLTTTFDPLVTAQSKFTVGGIDAYWRSKDYEFGAHDICKIFRYLRFRLKETGNISLDVYYIVDFNSIDLATKAVLSLAGAGMTWGVSLWGQATWGNRLTVRRRLSLRSTKDQSSIGNYLAVRIGNPRANEPFSVSGFDIEYKELGKRNQ